MTRLVVVSPVRDEAVHLARVVAAVRAQHRPPDLWVIVDDGSTDGTAEVARTAAAGAPWIRVVAAPPIAEDAVDRLAAATEATAFHVGLAEAGEDWDLLGKLDGDIVLAPEHFARLLDAFAQDPRLGIAGCFLEEEHEGRRVLQKMPEHHVNGALKVYRRACWAAIGGFEQRLAWDTIDETRARMLGFRTQSLRDLRALHLRPSGSAGGRLRGRMRHGACAWVLHYPPGTILARAAILSPVRPYGLHGLAYLAGWARAAVRDEPRRVEDPAFRAWVRAEQRARVAPALRRVMRRQPLPPH